MSKVKFKEIALFINGDRGKNYPSQDEILKQGEYLFINAGHLNDSGDLCFDDMNYISKDKYDLLNSGKIQENDILYCLRGSLGKKAIVRKGLKGAIASSLVIIRLNLDKADNKYIMYYLDSPSIQDQQNKANNGSSQPNLSASSVKEYLISLPPLETQRQIAANLDKATQTINLCNAILEKLDLLVKARFVEMFGDPVENPKNWDMRTLGELTTKIGSGATPKGGRNTYGTEGISLIRSMNVHNGYFEHKDLAHISDEQAEKLDNVTIQENDVLLNITGASVARSCIVPANVLPARVNQHVCIIRCKSCVLPLFVNSVLIDDHYQCKLWEIAGSGATREAITKQQIEMLSIIVPPLELQNQFAAFVEKTDRTKAAVKQVLAKAETLKKALMQEYFG